MELNEIFLNKQERKLLKKINFLTNNGQTRLGSVWKQNNRASDD